MREGHEKMLQAIGAIQSKTHRDISINQVSILLYTMEHEGSDMYEIEEKLMIPLPSVSRSTKELGKYIIKDEDDNKVMKGWNLITTEKDLENTRKLNLFLTSKGKELRKEINSILN